MTNKEYFDYSKTHKDNLDDFVNAEGVVVISKDASKKPTDLMVKVNALNNLITTYSTLKALGRKSDDKTIVDIVDGISKILETRNLNVNYSPFCVYFQVVRYAYATYKETYKDMSLEEKRDLIIYLLDEYLENRFNMYESHGYSPIVLQVMSDASSSRRNGTIGLKMLGAMLVPLGFVHAKTYDDLVGNNLCFIHSDKSEKKLFDEYLKNKGIKFEFRTTRDNKYPDMLIRVKEHVFIVEHKLTNGGGGSQNAEINEIISFLRYEESNSKVHYVSCLQGDFIQYLTGHSTQPKNIAQTNNINDALTRFPNNYFLNGKGLEKLINDCI